eukprot:973978-Prymnesium_polylepis.1
MSEEAAEGRVLCHTGEGAGNNGEGASRTGEGTSLLGSASAFGGRTAACAWREAREQRRRHLAHGLHLCGVVEARQQQLAALVL